MEPGRDEQRFPASQKNDWKSGHPPTCQMGNHPEINKAHVILATHTTDTSWQNNFSWWRFQRCHSNWVSQPRYRLKPFGGLSWGSRYEGVPPVNNQAPSNFVVSKDTDVAVLLLVHFDKMKCPKIWIHHCGSFRHRKRSASEIVGWISCPHWVWWLLGRESCWNVFQQY